MDEVQTVASRARRSPATIACYWETPDMRTRIERSLADAALGTTGSRTDFESLVEDASVGIAALTRCEPADLAWLGAAFDYGHCAPSCVLVTPHSLSRALRPRRIQSSRLHVVWTEEADVRLRHLLHRVEPWHRDPLRLLGHRLLSDFPLRRTLVESINHVCRVFADPLPGPPPSTVTALARGAALTTDTLRRHWREEVPLRCGLKQLLNWALLFWTIRRRAHTGWDAIAKQARVRRRTLERASVRLAECTLSGLVQDPERVRRRFRDWVREMSVE